VPHRLGENRTKVQFVTNSRQPYLIYLACLKTDTVSNTRYVQEAICEKLARDLGLDLGELLAELPPPRGKANHLFDQRIKTPRVGPSGAIEHIKGE
jgi:hypothetical protein